MAAREEFGAIHILVSKPEYTAPCNPLKAFGLESEVRGSCKVGRRRRRRFAAAALFLVSDQATAITAQILNVDGGMAFYRALPAPRTRAALNWPARGR